MQSRYRLPQYTNSAKTLTNCFVRPQGGVLKRPGTRYVAEVKNSANACRLIDFEYANSDAYVLEFGAGYIRFFRDGAQVLSTTEVTNGDFASDLSSWTDLDTGTGSSTWSAGTMALAGGAAGLARREQVLTYMGVATYTLTFTVTTNSCVLTIGRTSGASDIVTNTYAVGTHNVTFTPTSIGTTGYVYIGFQNANNNTSNIDNVSIDNPVYEIENPYSSSYFDNVHYAQSYDYIILTHRLYAPRQLIRYGHAQWRLSQVVFTDGPYEAKGTINTYTTYSTVTLTPSATTGSGVTMTASSGFFNTTDVGRMIRWRAVNTVAWGWCVITAYTSSTQVTVTINKDFTATTASREWRMGEWSATTGYPQTIAFHEQRSVWARTGAKPQTLWFSVAGDIFNMQPDDTAYKDAVIASSAMTYTISDTRANVVTGMASQKNLYVLSGSGAWLVTAPEGTALSPDNIKIVPVVAEGAKDIQPLVSRSAVLYANRFGRKLLEVGYKLDDDSYRTADIALLAEHLTVGSIKEMAQQIAPNYHLWVVGEDGSMASVTYLREQNVIAWARQELGGTDVAVKSIAVIPGTYEDQVWFIVSRTINGATVQTIEYLERLFLDQEIDNAKFLDCHGIYSGSSVSTITGLDYLEGETVECFDGESVVVVDTAVTSGSIDLQDSVTYAVVGLSYEMIVEPSPVAGLAQASSANGITIGRRGRVSRAILDVYNSYGGYIGQDADHLDLIPELSSDTYMNSAITLFTGQVEINLPTDYELNAGLYIKHNLPLPFYLTGIVYKISIAPGV